MKIITSFLLFVSMIFAACHSTKKMNTKNIESPKIASGSLGVFDSQGHRGCRGLMPENTIPAMINALGMSVVTLEMDVVITKDKKVILSHEPFFNHEITTRPNGSFVTEPEERSLNIYQMNYDEVKKYDVGLKPHPRFAQQQKMKAVKPLLAAVFDSVSNYMMMARRPYPFFNIETKCLPISDNLYHPGPAEFVDLLMQVIKEKGMEKQVLIQSFDFRTLQYLHKNYPGIPTVMLIEDADKTSFENQLKKLGFNASIYSPHYSLVTEELIKKCHANHMRIIPWTVNDKETIARLKKGGVDGIISDYPNLFN
jgi:glycerophosphoryl diester phosphodiesterase